MRDRSTHADLEQLGSALEPVPPLEQLRAMPCGQLLKAVFAGAVARNRRREQLLAERKVAQRQSPES
jgi:hypothetical protein